MLILGILIVRDAAENARDGEANVREGRIVAHKSVARIVAHVAHIAHERIEARVACIPARVPQNILAWCK